VSGDSGDSGDSDDSGARRQWFLWCAVVTVTAVIVSTVGVFSTGSFHVCSSQECIFHRFASLSIGATLVYSLCSVTSF
jgi:hypothetical protein